MKTIVATAAARSSAAPLFRPKGGRRTARPSRSAASRRPAVQFLLSKTIEFLLSTGEPPEHLALELEAQARRVKGRLRLSSAGDAKHVQDSRERCFGLAGVLHDWHREPAYTNQDGDPRQLTLRSLRTLVGKRFPRGEISASVRWLFESGVVKRTSRGMIALVGGRALIEPSELLDRA